MDDQKFIDNMEKQTVNNEGEDSEEIEIGKVIDKHDKRYKKIFNKDYHDQKE